MPWDSNPASGRWVPVLALLQITPGIGGANSWLARMKLVAGPVAATGLSGYDPEHSTASVPRDKKMVASDGFTPPSPEETGLQPAAFDYSANSPKDWTRVWVLTPAITVLRTAPSHQPGHTGKGLQPGSNRHLTQKEHNWCDLSV